MSEIIIALMVGVVISKVIFTLLVWYAIWDTVQGMLGVFIEE